MEEPWNPFSGPFLDRSARVPGPEVGRRINDARISEEPPPIGQLRAALRREARKSRHAAPQRRADSPGRPSSLKSKNDQHLQQYNISSRIEITSKNDIFFHYAHSVDAHGFRSMQDQQKLMIEFPDYLSVLIRMLNSCIMDPHVYLAVLAMRQDGSARLDFVQNLEYKFIELLSCDFLASSEEMVRQQVTFQYNSMSRRLEAMKTHLQDISELVKVKNPSLLLQLKRAARPRAGAAR
ncbi:unnamed protein product [Prorocentrum cordatum]|uniref:Spindle assembly abnormal protein 6 N-terminal domain-containing protein n=1 Tax=Prorocentrum cordatum TaxID=2364126 RepID=A0ABN9RTB4_9DINO|nr:unnamed protein product [Polarella glacialis]